MTIDSSAYSPCLGHFLLSVRCAKFNRSNSICFANCSKDEFFHWRTKQQCRDLFWRFVLSRSPHTSTNFSLRQCDEQRKRRNWWKRAQLNLRFLLFSHWFSWNHWKATLKSQLHLKGNRLSSPSNDQIFIHLFNFIHINLFSFKDKTIPFKLKIYTKKLLSNCRFYLKISSIHIVKKSQIFFFLEKKTRRLKRTVHRSNPSVRSIHFAKSLKSIKTRISHWSSLVSMHHWHSSSLPSFHYAQFFSTEFNLIHFDNRTIYPFALRITAKIHFSFNENHRTIHQYLWKTPIWSSQTNTAAMSSEKPVWTNANWRSNIQLNSALTHSTRLVKRWKKLQFYPHCSLALLQPVFQQIIQWKWQTDAHSLQTPIKRPNQFISFD